MYIKTLKTQMLTCIEIILSVYKITMLFQNKIMENNNYQ